MIVEGGADRLLSRWTLLLLMAWHLLDITLYLVGACYIQLQQKWIGKSDVTVDDQSKR